DYPVTRRASFAAVKRVIDDWARLMMWRVQQRDNERDQRLEQAKAVVWTSEARTAQAQFREAPLVVRRQQEDLARPRRSPRIVARLTRRLERSRALVPRRRTLLVPQVQLARS